MHIGIDPALSGALAVLDTVGALVALCDTPVLHLPMARGRGHEYDVLGLVALLAPYAGPQIHVLLGRDPTGHARPRRTAVRSTLQGLPSVARSFSENRPPAASSSKTVAAVQSHSVRVCPCPRTRHRLAAR